MLEGGKPPQTMLIISRNALTVGVFLFPVFFPGGCGWFLNTCHILPPHCSKTIFVHLQLVPVGQEIVKLQSSFDRATAAADKARLRWDTSGGQYWGITLMCGGLTKRHHWFRHCSSFTVFVFLGWSWMFTIWLVCIGQNNGPPHCIAVHIQGRSHPRDSFEMGRTSPPLLNSWIPTFSIHRRVRPNSIWKHQSENDHKPRDHLVKASAPKVYCLPNFWKLHHPCCKGPCGRAVGADGGGEGREGAAHFGTNAAGREWMVGFDGEMAEFSL